VRHKRTAGSVDHHPTAIGGAHNLNRLGCPPERGRLLAVARTTLGDADIDSTCAENQFFHAAKREPRDDRATAASANLQT